MGGAIDNVSYVNLPPSTIHHVPKTIQITITIDDTQVEKSSPAAIAATTMCDRAVFLSCAFCSIVAYW